jgi:hypothetical protein
MIPRPYDGAASRMAARVGAVWMTIFLLVAAYFSPKIAATGWLTGFTFWAQILSGSLALMMIHRLTGGRWGLIAAPVISSATAVVPALIFLAVPLFVAIPVLYPWSHGDGTIKPGVLSYYLNLFSFVLRSVVALLGWSALAWLIPRLSGAKGQLIAALGLVFYALTISSIGIDWYLALEAPFTSSSFGASVAITSLIAALAWIATVLPEQNDNPAIGDIGGLLLATILGLTYIDFMAVLVIWYGDLPREEAWFVEREHWPWLALGIAAFVLASQLPVLALLLSRIRNARKPLQRVGICTLIGIAIYTAYLIAPPAGAWALLTSLFAIVGIGLALVGLGPAGRGLFGMSAPAALVSSEEPVRVR